MPIKVELRDGTILNFQDGTPEDVIQQKTKEEWGKIAKPQPLGDQDVSKLLPFPGLLRATIPATMGGGVPKGQEKDLGYLLNPIPEGLQELTQSVTGNVRKY